jgi:hypothetical protein
MSTRRGLQIAVRCFWSPTQFRPRCRGRDRRMGTFQTVNPLSTKGCYQRRVVRRRPGPRLTRKLARRAPFGVLSGRFEPILDLVVAGLVPPTRSSGSVPSQSRLGGDDPSSRAAIASGRSRPQCFPGPAPGTCFCGLAFPWSPSLAPPAPQRFVRANAASPASLNRQAPGLARRPA